MKSKLREGGGGGEKLIDLYNSLYKPQVRPGMLKCLYEATHCINSY